jgi:hypothetical protein
MRGGGSEAAQISGKRTYVGTTAARDYGGQHVSAQLPNIPRVDGDIDRREIERRSAPSGVVRASSIHTFGRISWRNLGDLAGEFLEA